jgi:hypothetical protein
MRGTTTVPSSYRRAPLDWTHKYPAIAKAVAALDAHRGYLDGELCGVGPTASLCSKSCSSPHAMATKVWVIPQRYLRVARRHCRSNPLDPGTALRRGQRVTLFNRGVSAVPSKQPLEELLDVELPGVGRRRAITGADLGDDSSWPAGGDAPSRELAGTTSEPSNSP